MIRNVDLDKTIRVKNILHVLESHFPEQGTKSFKNPEGFGGHYLDVDNEDIIDTHRVVREMIEAEESDWR